MKVTDQRALKRLLALMRQQNVTRLRAGDGDLEIELGPVPASSGDAEVATPGEPLERREKLPTSFADLGLVPEGEEMPS